MSAALHWPLEAIWESLAPRLPGFSVELLPEVDSTNSELMRRARQGRLEPVLLVAQHQSAGRGRLGRQWLSAPTAADAAPATLTFSLALTLDPVDWSGLSLAVGLSLAQSLHPDIRLKWPNDLWWQQRKLAGILIETSSSQTGSGRQVVIGVGINIRAPQAQGLSTPPAGLDEILPGIDAAQTLARVAGPLLQTVLAFESSGFAPLQHAFNARDALARTEVVLSDGQHGLAQGVDARGGLQLLGAHGLQRITSAEVSVRPNPNPPL